MKAEGATVVGVVQARTGSTRMPGKVLRRLAGRSVLEWVVRAVREADCVDELVVATTTEPGDDAVVAECERLGVRVARGPVHDVLGRFLLATEQWQPDAVTRFTADCPLLPPDLAAAVVATWRASPWLDFVNTAMPRCVPRGMDVEIIKGETLRGLDVVQEPHHRTHVTSYVYTHPERYWLMGMKVTPDSSDLRVTLDTEDDFRLIEHIVAELGDRPPLLPELVEFLRSRPDIVEMNSHVRQKRLEAG